MGILRIKVADGIIIREIHISLIFITFYLHKCINNDETVLITNDCANEVLEMTFLTMHMVGLREMEVTHLIREGWSFLM
jgi:hypothetical protein